MIDSLLEGTYIERKNNMNKCKICGGFYDAGEKCSCEERSVPVKRFMTHKEHMDMLTSMSYEEFTAYQKRYDNRFSGRKRCGA